MTWFVENMRSGGYAMWPVLILGLLTLVGAIHMARKPISGKPVAIKALTVATLLLGLGGSMDDFSAAMSKIANTPEWAHSPEIHLIIMTGLGEAMGPASLACSLLGLAWVFVAIGSRRLANQLG